MYNGVDNMGASISQINRNEQGPIQAGHNRYLWIVSTLVIGAVLAHTLIRQGLPVLYPFIQNEFGLSRAEVGLITSALSIGYMVSVLVAGWLTDTLGVKRMITVSLLALTAMTLAFPLAYSYTIVLALAAFNGIVTSPIHPATTRAVIDWFPSRIRALAMSIKQMGWPIAGTLMAAVLPALAVAIGWRMAVAAAGPLILAVAIALILLYRDAPRNVQAVNKIDLASLKTMLHKRSLVVTIIWDSAFMGFQFTVLSYFMLFVIEELKLSLIMAGGLLAIAQFSSIIARVLWGAISDFLFGGRRIVVLAIIGFITALWMLGASFVSMGVPSIIVYLIAIVIGISTFSFHGVLYTLIGEQSEAGEVGITIGVAGTVDHVSQTIMPPLFGYVVDASSSYSLAWKAAAALALVCTLALLVLAREPKHR
ncbi:MFS transporter [Chloroflexota bacterium]